jgi:hypothetical protein
MHQLPFNRPGKFFKGNLHTHSTLSDGKLTPEEICHLYLEGGYDFIALTDHFMKHYHWTIADTTPFRTESFTTLIGAELHAPGITFEYLWHILAVGLPLDFAPNVENETGTTLAQRAVDAGAFVAIAHPDWYHLPEADALLLNGVHAMEIFNGTSVDHNDKPGGWSLLDILLGRGIRYTALATDDAHFEPARSDAMIGWVMVRAEELSPEALLASLKAGYFYSSTGPEIYDLQIIPGDVVTIRCSPAERIFVVGKGSQATSAYGNGITGAEIKIDRFKSPYIRVIVRDTFGRRAWSNAIWQE